MPDKKDNNQPDLLDAVDLLLEEVARTTESFAPAEEITVDPNALITDDGTIAPPQPPTSPTLDTPAEPAAEGEEDSASPGIVDSIENAKQALDALDEVESQAEDLVAQSVDALLESTESATETETETELSTPDLSTAPEPEAEPEPEPEPEQSNIATDTVEEPPATEIDQEETIADAVDEPDDQVDDQAQDQTDDLTEGQDDDLMASIDQLLEESPVEADEPEAPAADTQPETEPAPTDEQIDEQVDEQPQPEAQSSIQTEAPAEPEPVAESIEEPVAESIEEPVVDDSAPAPKAGTSEPDESGDPMDLLDSALAEAADDMLDGDFETEEGELVTGEAVASAIEEALEAQTESDSQTDDTETDDALGAVADDLLGSDPAPAPPPPVESPVAVSLPATEAVDEPVTQTVPQTSQSPAPEPEPQPELVSSDSSQSEIDALEELQNSEPAAFPAWFVRCIEIIRPKIDKIDPLKGKTMDAAAFVLGTVIVTVATHATPIAARVMILLSKPLANKSPELRNAVGYITLWTGFLAAVVWIYLLMFRAPTIPSPEAAPTRVISADESLIIQPVIEVLP